MSKFEPGAFEQRFELNKKFGEDPEDSMVFSNKKKIFEISSHDLVKENVKNVYR